ncbi:MAG TPA: PIN domain-containing protein [Methanofastidiosum sp.]|nr:PIN domain-containing protein [Methanofastidiosum sp.]
MQTLTSFSLNDYPEDTNFFIDSNVFIYFLLKHKSYSPTIKSFFNDIEKGQIKGYVNHTVVSESYFNYIRIKICERYTITPKEFNIYMKTNPDALREIDLSVVEDIFSLPNLYFLNIENIKNIGSAIYEYSLLPNDATHVASCIEHGLTNIVTNDKDFERVNFLKVWKP